MNVREMMHRGVEWVSPDTPIAAVAQKMQQHDIGALPIGENDRLIGMVTDRDITMRAVATAKNCATLTARDVMSKRIVYCRDTDTVADAIATMERKQVRRLPVLDTNKRMVGMLSLGDISHAASQQHCAQAIKAVSAHHA